MKRIAHLVGARPNFMKTAPLWRVLGALGVEQRLIHSGQHYDADMSDVFLRELGLPEANAHLGVGSASHGAQTAAVMIGVERELGMWRPDLLVVVGDVNTTLGGTLAAAKTGVPVAHVEAGLRSFDRSMPEELNRIATDVLADVLLTPSPDADRNLLAEGRAASAIHRVGNLMIDSLVRVLPRLGSSTAPRDFAGGGRYAVLTMHRPSNVDDDATLRERLAAIAEVARRLPVLFPAHPRTRARLEGRTPPGDLRVLPPLGYLDFVALERGATLVITDSGGVQEETTYLGVPCLTIRSTTERPITVEVGTNEVVGSSREALLSAVDHILAGGWKRGRIPELWDGHAAERAAAVLAAFVGGPTR
jgi:UDP-N-acetylglucosamine 2-epimerase (non-hydrolysing)